MHVQLDRANAAHEFMREYMELVTRTKAPRQYIDDITHMALGLTTEAGEVADIVKKSVFYKDTKAEAADTLWKQKEHMAEELGDVLWYVAGMAHDYSLDLVTIMQDNIKKLQVRYPDKFKSVDANLRNPLAEALIFNQMPRPDAPFGTPAPGTVSNVQAYVSPPPTDPHHIINQAIAEGIVDENLVKFPSNFVDLSQLSKETRAYWVQLYAAFPEAVMDAAREVVKGMTKEQLQDLIMVDCKREREGV